MLIAARSKALLGARPDAASAAHGGAQDLGLFAVPPGAFGASLSTSPSVSTLSVAKSQDAGSDGTHARPALDLSPPDPGFGAPGLGAVVPASAGMASMQAASPAALASSQPPAPASVPASDAPIFATAGAAEPALGSSGGSIPNAGLPPTSASVPSPAPPAIEPGVAPLSDVAPLIASVGASVAGLQAGMTVLIGPMGATGRADALLHTIAEQGAMLGQNITALSNGVVTIPEAALGSMGDILTGVSDAATQVAQEIGTLVPSVIGLPGGAQPLLDQSLQPATSVIAATLDDTSSLAAGAISSVSDASGAIVEQTSDITVSAAETVDTVAAAATDGAVAATQLVEPVASQVVDTLADLAGENPLGGVDTLTSLVSAADIFETHDEAPQTSGLFVLRDAADTLDGLIDGDGASDDSGGLLGTAQHEDGLLNGLTGHDEHGGFGLGLG